MIPRWAAIFYLAAAAIVAAACVAAVNAAGPHRVIGHGQIRFRGHGPEWWAARYRQAHRQTLLLRGRLRHQQHLILTDPTVVESINLACATYGNCTALWRIAWCETGGTLSPRSLNSSSGAAGLFQFLPSTWQTTPYAPFSVWDPAAAALGAGWMISHGRRSEWVCR